jgi:hypothetical protein
MVATAAADQLHELADPRIVEPGMAVVDAGRR